VEPAGDQKKRCGWGRKAPIFVLKITVDLIPVWARVSRPAHEAATHDEALVIKCNPLFPDPRWNLCGHWFLSYFECGLFIKPSEFIKADFQNLNAHLQSVP
jgi:hypothetical protein